jgi:hypothetical protein
MFSLLVSYSLEPLILSFACLYNVLRELVLMPVGIMSAVVHALWLVEGVGNSLRF